jgi:hypothetical protein
VLGRIIAQMFLFGKRGWGYRGEFGRWRIGLFGRVGGRIGGGGEVSTLKRRQEDARRVSPTKERITIDIFNNRSFSWYCRHIPAKALTPLSSQHVYYRAV